jgi:anti-sigma factor RsiW
MNSDESKHPDDPLVGRYHDGEFTPAERAEAERRIAGSAPLREELGWYRRLGAAFRHGAPAGAPAGLAARIMHKIRAMETSDHPLIRLLPLMNRLAVAAAILILVAAAVVFVRHVSAKPSAPGDREDIQMEHVSLFEPVHINVPTASDLLY